MKKIAALILAASAMSAFAGDPAADAKNNIATQDWMIRQSGDNLTRAQAVRTLTALYRAADNRGIGRDLALKVAVTESHFDPTAISAAKAKGVMQVICKWHTEKCAGKDMHNVDHATDVGAQVLAEYLKMEHGDLTRALHRYNSLDGHPTKYARKVLAVKLPAGADGLGGVRTVALKSAPKPTRDKDLKKFLKTPRINPKVWASAQPSAPVEQAKPSVVQVTTVEGKVSMLKGWVNQALAAAKADHNERVARTAEHQRQLFTLK